MPETVRYCCRVHDDVVLFTETPRLNAIRLAESFRMIKLAEKPRECPKCDKSYYKSQCRPLP